MSSMDLSYIALPFALTQTSTILFFVSSSPSPERETRIKFPSVPESENCCANAIAADLPNPRLAPVIKQQGLEPLQNIILQRTLIQILTQSVARGFCVARGGTKLCSITRDWTQIIHVTPDRRSQHDAWFSILQARDAWFTGLPD